MEALYSLFGSGGEGDPRDLIYAMSYTMIGSGIAAFIALTFVEAPYGKYSDKAAWFYGPPINGKVAWILQECPSFLIPAYYLYKASAAGPEIAAELATLTPRSILSTMFLLHYFNRSFVYPMRIQGGKPTPLVVALMALVFCLCNGYMQGNYLSTYATEQGTDVLSPSFLVGVLLFFSGMTINTNADDILRGLRKPGETGYKIPRGGAFEFVSGANFFGEIMEWTGFAIAAGSLPAAAFALFTFCNIGPRGAQHHRWYLSKFPDYPKDRKAVIPFVW